MDALNRHTEWLIFAIVMLLALGLRLVQLGQDSFWIDEVGIITIARQPTLMDTLQTAREHIAAMPLDYLQTRWVDQLTNGREGGLRLPAAIWGTLAVAAAYACLRPLTNAPIGLMTVFWFSLTPLHIQYSQEVRFYAAGSFFYLLATVLLWKALHTRQLRWWLAAGLALVVGAYFHIYTLLALVSAGFWLLGDHRREKTVWKRFILLCGAVSLLVLPGAWYYLPETHMEFPFHAGALVANLSAGLGWMPYTLSSSPLLFLHGLITFCLSITGLAAAIRHREKSFLLWVAAIFCQIILVCAASILAGYFSAARQYLNFLPLSGSLAARGLWELWTQSRPFIRTRKPVTPEQVRGVNRLLAGFLLGIWLFSTLPGLSAYYQAHKSHGKEISAILTEILQPGDQIWVNPPYETGLYRFYLQQENAAVLSQIPLVGIRPEDMAEPLPSAPIYLLTRAGLTSVQSARLAELGFSPYWSDDAPDFEAQQIYYRPAH